MLARIREHLTASAPFDRVHREAHQKHEAGESFPVVEHSTSYSLIDLFRQALESVNGNCTIVADEAAAASSLKQVIELNKLQRIAVSDSPIVGRLMQRVEGCTSEVLSNAEPDALFDCDGGITGAQWAIAETGTLVLETKSERHRLVSLVPAMHIAIVAAGRILGTMSEALAAVSTAGELSRTVTFITGPSRTSDIELTLAIGVHGPARLHVIVIDDVKQTV